MIDECLEFEFQVNIIYPEIDIASEMINIMYYWKEEYIMSNTSLGKYMRWI